MRNQATNLALVRQFFANRWPNLFRHLRTLGWLVFRRRLPPGLSRRPTYEQYVDELASRHPMGPLEQADPGVAMLVWLKAGSEEAFRGTLDSIEMQSNYQLPVYLAGDSDEIQAVIAGLSPAQTRSCHLQPCIEADTWHAAVCAMQESWVLVVMPGCALLPGFLSRWYQDIGAHPGSEFWYCDHASTQAEGADTALVAKTVWDPVRLQSQNYIGNAFAVKRGRLADAASALHREPGGFASVHDILRQLAQFIAPERALHSPCVLFRDPKAYSLNAIHSVAGGRTLPAVSVIVPTRDGWPHLARCVESVQAAFSATPHVEAELLLVDNGSSDTATLEYLSALEAKAEKSMRILKYNAPFNFSAINNWAVRQAHGEAILLLNDDVEATSDQWLESMLVDLMEPAVGVVGARLLYPDKRIQHTGIALGLGGVAGHPCRGLSLQDRRSQAWGANVRRSVSAVTAACLLTSKQVYWQVAGLDADNLAVAFNDVDFCLKVGKAGYRVVYEPLASLIHLESVSRGQENTLAKQKRFAGEVHTMQQRWGWRLNSDPFYSPHWSLQEADLSLRWPVADTNTLRHARSG